MRSHQVCRQRRTVRNIALECCEQLMTSINIWTSPQSRSLLTWFPVLRSLTMKLKACWTHSEMRRYPGLYIEANPSSLWSYSTNKRILIQHYVCLFVHIGQHFLLLSNITGFTRMYLRWCNGNEAKATVIKNVERRSSLRSRRVKNISKSWKYVN